MTEDAAPQVRGAEVVPESAAPLSIHEEAVIEAGRRLLIESVDVSRDFAKQMIAVSTGAIPIYVALLGLADIKHRATTTLVFSALPPVGFLVSALFFILALLPRPQFFSVQIIDQVRQARKNLLQTRYRWIVLGLIMFGVSIISSIVVVLTLMATR